MKKHSPPSPLQPPPSISKAQPLPRSVDPKDPLAIALFYHQENNLTVAAYYYSHAAARGTPLGLFMYALALRHGWGVPEDQLEAVRLLRMATDAVLLSKSSITDPTTPYRASLGRPRANAVLAPLVVAVYELGVSFMHGWGVDKNKLRAAYYFNMAAQLGDKDAQTELAHCYMRGDGVCQDKRQAAKWFRKAEQQGVHMVQMQWIWKAKYD